MTTNPNFTSPCGLYCGVCAIHIAGRDNNQVIRCFAALLPVISVKPNWSWINHD